MVKLKLQGGLGNQMFIYAFAKTLEHMGYPVCLDARIYNFYRQKNHKITDEKTHTSIRKLELLDFNPQIPLVCHSSKWANNDQMTPIHLKLIGKFKKYFFEVLEKKNTLSESCIIQANNKITPPPPYKNFCLDGYFCNVEYFHHLHSELQEDFKLKKQLSHENLRLKEEIIKTPNSCFIHIRRGDYLSDHNWMFVKLGKTYYKTAINLIYQKLQNPKFFIFSNDLQWCKNHFLELCEIPKQNQKDFVFVEQNTEGDASSELELMKSCQNAIIANSTFSWWGAYLQKNENKIIILPDKWLYSEDISQKIIPSCNLSSQQWYCMDWCWGTIKTQKEIHNEK